MTKGKRGMETGTYVFILVAVIGGIVLFVFVVPLFGKTSGGAVVMLKRWAGLTPESNLEEQREAERVDRELKENAERVYLRFGDNIKKCLEDKSSSKPCVCPQVDFTELSDYSLKISDSGGKKTLELLDSNLVPVSGNKATIGEVAFIPGDLGSGFYAAAELDFYNRPTPLTKTLLGYNQAYLLFSKDRLMYGANIENLKNRMNQVNFIKLRKGITLGHNEGERISQEIQFNIEKDTIVIEDNNFEFNKCSP